MKKGQAQNFFIVITIIAVLSLVVGIVLFVNLGGKVQENQKVTDAFCKSKIQTLSEQIEPGENELTESFITLTEAFRASCIPQTDIIDPQEWDACDSSFKEQSRSEPTAAATNCAMQQVADRIERCWDMSGEGRLNTFSWACFNIVISEASETPEVSDYNDFKNQIIKTFNCPLFDNDCKDYARASLNNATVLAAYNNLIDITETTIKGKIEICRKTEIAEGVEESSDERNYQQDLLNKRPEEVYLEFDSTNTEVVLNKYVKDEVIEIGDQEVDCTLEKLTPEIEENLEDLEKYHSDAQPHEAVVLRNYNQAHKSELTQLPFQLQKDTRLETDTIKFTEAELTSFMKDTPIEGRVVNHCNTISYRGKDCDERVEYYPEGFTVKQNKLFSIEYCGDVLPFESTIVATNICEAGKDQRRILVSDVPTGGGSRLINENLKYNCPILETAADITGASLFEGLADICQTGVARTLLST